MSDLQTLADMGLRPRPATYEFGWRCPCCLELRRIAGRKRVVIAGRATWKCANCPGKSRKA